ncbi:uncharacterized protein LOC134280925 [Saccostrea cucullata]|uniref:uncharacterized protein LOC134280925 n=1 Tax=Saccostrea cuccullata TaxID=36930 RepID=UPI002ED41465
MPFIVKPFIIKYMNDSDSKCKGCKSKIGSGSLVLGYVADQGPDKRVRCLTSWFHYKCFWTLCVYKNHLRGVDPETLNEIVFGINGLSKADKFNFQNEASSPPASTRRRSSRTSESNIIAAKDVGSVESGDYEVNENVFDLSDLVCATVYKHQTNVFVSIREFFLLKGSNVAKPSKRGISLNKHQWRELCSIQNGIEAATKIMAARDSKSKDAKGKDKKSRGDNSEEEEEDGPGQILFSLSWKRRVSVYQHQEEVIVDIREYSEDRTFQRSTKGVALSKAQWTKLREEMPNIEALVQHMEV